jgi:hypothetical protein
VRGSSRSAQQQGGRAASSGRLPQCGAADAEGVYPTGSACEGVVTVGRAQAAGTKHWVLPAHARARAHAHAVHTHREVPWRHVCLSRSVGQLARGPLRLGAGRRWGGAAAGAACGPQAQGAAAECDGQAWHAARTGLRLHRAQHHSSAAPALLSSGLQQQLQDGRGGGGSGGRGLARGVLVLDYGARVVLGSALPLRCLECNDGCAEIAFAVGV